MFTGNFELTWINEIGIEYITWFDKLRDLTEYVTKNNITNYKVKG